MLKAAKIDNGCVKMSWQYFQNLNQVNLLVEFKIKIIKSKIVNFVKMFLIICCLKELCWITITWIHQNIAYWIIFISWLNFKFKFETPLVCDFTHSKITSLRKQRREVTSLSICLVDLPEKILSFSAADERAPGKWSLL